MLDTTREIIVTVVTQYSAPCAFCKRIVLSGHPRSKVWRKGMKTTRKQKNGPGLWMHPDCALRWQRGQKAA